MERVLAAKYVILMTHMGEIMSESNNNHVISMGYWADMESVSPTESRNKWFFNMKSRILHGDYPLAACCQLKGRSSERLLPFGER